MKFEGGCISSNRTYRQRTWYIYWSTQVVAEVVRSDRQESRGECPERSLTLVQTNGTPPSRW